MKVEQIYTGCLAQGTYYIESDGEAVIIDPLRESKPYLEKANKEGATIKYIFETHFHADFVSGHVDLAQKSGAQIVYGPGAKADFEYHEATDGEELSVGKVKFKTLHTPGHTLESTTFLLIDEEGKEYAAFTGDTLFIGDVGRPDLAQKGDMTQEDLAGLLYDSLRDKVMTLPDDLIVYPAHGAGSACGKNMSKETFDTLGNQKRFNYALREDMTKADFVKEVTAGLLPPPQYFAQNVALNKADTAGLDKVMETGTVALDPEAMENMVNSAGALILDTRTPKEFAESHIPNSIFIGIDGGFAPWVGALIPSLDQPIVFICESGREEEVVTRLSRVGYDNTLGFLDGGILSWIEAGQEIDAVDSISAADWAKKIKYAESEVLDVRKPSEFEASHLEIAKNFPLDFISENMGQLDKTKSYDLHCAGGYRSMIAASILKSRGFHQLLNIEGGFKAISETDMSVTTFSCPSNKS